MFLYGVIIDETCYCDIMYCESGSLMFLLFCDVFCASTT